METNLSKKRMDEAMSWAITKRLADIRGLLNTNGVDTSSMPDRDVQIAFLKAVKDSQAFRDAFSSYLANFVYTNANANFVSQPMLNYIDDDYDGFDDYTGEPAGSSLGSGTPPAPAPKKSGSFWSSLGSLASPSNLQSLFNTGLGVVSTSLTNKANEKSELNALELERIRLQQIQAQKDLEAQKGSNGLPGWAWGLIIVGSVGLVVGIIFMVKK